MASSPTPPPAPRQLALDVFRGVGIAALLLVVSPGPGHALPAGVRAAPLGALPALADLVQPWLLLAMGIAMAFWIPPRIAGAGVWRPRRTRTLWRALLVVGSAALLVPGVGDRLGSWRWPWLIGLAACLQQVAWDLPKGEFWCRVLRRAWTLLVLGWLVHSSTVHRLALDLTGLALLAPVTVTGAVLYHFAWRHRAWWVLGLLLLHWALLRFVPHPELGAPVLTADQHLLRWQGALAVVPATACALIGSLAGEVVRAPTLVGSERTTPVLAAGALLMVLGWLWHLDQPMLADAWTTPFVLWSCGLGLLLFGGLVHGIDVRGHRGWCAPLALLGRNALAVSVGVVLLLRHTVDEWPPLRDAVMQPLVAVLGAPAGALAWGALWLVAAWGLCRGLERRGWQCRA